MIITRFFISNAFFQPQCCLTFSWIELQMLLRCCLIRISIIVLRHFWYSLYLCPCLDQGLFMSYLCDPCDFIHPAQVSRWDVPRWLPRSINLLKLFPWSQTMPSRPINKLFFYRGHKETLSPVILEKLVVPTEIEYFQHGPRSSN